MLFIALIVTFSRSTAPRQEQGITMVLKCTVLISQIGAWILGPLGIDAARIFHSVIGHNRHRRRRGVSASWLCFGAFSWESRVGPRHWRKAFLFIFPLIWAFANCATLFILFYFIWFFISIHGLIFVSFWFFLTNHLVRKRWITNEYAHPFRNKIL